MIALSIISYVSGIIFIGTGLWNSVEIRRARSAEKNLMGVSPKERSALAFINYMGGFRTYKRKTIVNLVVGLILLLMGTILAHLS